jgi:hypothetical protein
MERQPPRRREGLRALIEEAALHERIGHKLLQILRCTTLHAGGNFFGKEFEEKIGHRRTLCLSEETDGGSGHAATPPPSVFSHAAPQAFASSRTRRM